jgi:hypothetical protein
MRVAGRLNTDRCTRGTGAPGSAPDSKKVSTVPARHEMILTGSGESGAEEWVCPTCGRRMLLRWPPHYEKLILEYGDEAAIHVGGKGELRVSGVAVAPAPAGETPAVETPVGDAPVGEFPVDEVPEAERQWLQENGIDWDDASA